MSHLIELADEVDPERKRFKATGLDKLIDEVQAIPLRYKEEVLDGEDLIQRYMDIDNDPKNENPALHNQAVHKLAIEAKRSNAAEIERLIDTHEIFTTLILFSLFTGMYNLCLTLANFEDSFLTLTFFEFSPPNGTTSFRLPKIPSVF